MNVKPAIKFLTKDGQAPFTDKVTTILEWMLQSILIYGTPLPTLAPVQTAFNTYKVATANAAKGGVENTAIRDARRAELVLLLRQLANYVSATANGDLEALIASGFPVQKTTNTPVGPLATPEAPVFSQGAVTGTATAVAKPVSGASSYHWRLALGSAPFVYVQSAQTTGARKTFGNVTPGEIYNVELNAFATAGTSDWSDIGSLRVI